MSRPSPAVIILSIIATGCAATALAAAESAVWLVALGILFLVGGTVAGTFWLLDRRELGRKLATYGEGEQFLAEATAEHARITAEAPALLAQAEADANEIRDAARRAATQLREESEQSAATRRQELDAQLKKTETQIAELAAEFETYTRAIDAAKRKLADCANDLVTPARSALDTLPSDLSRTDAAQRLKQAREFTRKLVQTEQAAAHTDTDAARGKAAARFITNAFNGKFDSLLTRLRQTPYATLRQEALDAYNEVNLGAAPFKARITDAYLDARLDELKYAVITLELRSRERDTADVE